LSPRGQARVGKLIREWRDPHRRSGCYVHAKIPRDECGQSDPWRSGCRSRCWGPGTSARNWSPTSDSARHPHALADPAPPARPNVVAQHDRRSGSRSPVCPRVALLRRRSQLLLQPLYGAGAQADELGGLQHTRAPGELVARRGWQPIGPWPDPLPEPLVGDEASDEVRVLW